MPRVMTGFGLSVLSRSSAMSGFDSSVKYAIGLIYFQFKITLLGYYPARSLPTRPNCWPATDSNPNSRRPSCCICSSCSSGPEIVSSSQRAICEHFENGANSRVAGSYWPERSSPASWGPAGNLTDRGRCRFCCSRPNLKSGRRVPGGMPETRCRLPDGLVNECGVPSTITLCTNVN